MDEATKKRYKAFAGGRIPTFYTQELQNAHHIHVPAHDEHRILQHHYAFAFFQDPNMQSFYRRFVRDYMRYNGEINDQICVYVCVCMCICMYDTFDTFDTFVFITFISSPHLISSPHTPLPHIISSYLLPSPLPPSPPPPFHPSLPF